MKIEIDGDSPEAVAFALLEMVARAEGRLDASGAWQRADRAWVLDTYAECLDAVIGEREPAAAAEDDDADEDEGEEDEDEPETGAASPAR